MKRTTQIVRTGFKRKPFRSKVNEDKPPLPYRHGKAARRASRLSVGRKPLNKVGPRTRDWRAVWRFLKPRLEAAGRTGCEFNFLYHDCWGRLDPCHSKKRRLMKGDDIYAVAIGCAQVHRILDEVLDHADMEEMVMRAINRAGGMILPKEMQ